MDKPNRLNVNMSDNEKKNIKKFNKDANKELRENFAKNDVLNMSIKEVFNDWARTNLTVFSELVTFVSTMGKYSKYFDDIDETRQWYNGIMAILRNLLSILTKDKRPIYVGITLILLSFALHLIQITS